ncbi:unnamed protein product [Pocillopora meandrina]|uniref:Endonuclease/exonuclease/phosphatase domain-containing protein n=1 Tax=Pocillopora meandrina TaxID=46732 RepID=A0AAU9WJA9_9CNID|nr:unnamed protein product [Pocillopora meandrina]
MEVIKNQQLKINKLNKELLYMEAYSRRENLIITGIPESREDTGVEDTAKVLVDFMANELNVSNAADIDFQRLTDVWRMCHPGKKRFTWRQPNSTIQRRLDFWLISNLCQEDISSTDIIPAIKKDHSAITLIFKKVADHKPGPSYWKFNSSLVDDSKYIDFIKSSHPMWLVEYKDITSKHLL